MRISWLGKVQTNAPLFRMDGQVRPPAGPLPPLCREGETHFPTGSLTVMVVHHDGQVVRTAIIYTSVHHIYRPAPVEILPDQRAVVGRFSWFWEDRENFIPAERPALKQHAPFRAEAPCNVRSRKPNGEAPDSVPDPPVPALRHGTAPWKRDEPGIFMFLQQKNQKIVMNTVTARHGIHPLH